MKKALCIGINNYPGFTNDLKGCVNDAIDWEVLLLHAGFETRKILDNQATRKNMLDGLEDLVVNASPGDEVVFTYSGHGTSVTDHSGDEIDGYDEALVAYDGNILDDELRTILQKSQKDVHIVVVADSCFSGTVTRALLSGTAMPRFQKTDDIAADVPVKKHLLADEEMVEILITGCTDSEYSYDAQIDGRWNGAMSAYATSVILAEQTYNDFYQLLRQRLPSNDYPQTPQLEGSDANKNWKVFATNTEPLPSPDPVDGPDGIWDWIKKYWWVIVLVLVVGFILWRVL
jgi:metacaspase-1